jgi:hypothetical protein
MVRSDRKRRPDPEDSYMQTTPVPHLPDEELELYSLGRLEDAQLRQLEEHLLLCEHCQRRLEETDTFVLAMRQAAAEFSEGQSSLYESLRTRIHGLFMMRKMAWAAGAALAVVTLVVSVAPLARNSAPDHEVLLQAMRGLEASGIASAPAKAHLVLKIDLTEAPARPSYRIEVADSAGRTVWDTRAEPVHGALALRLGRSLKPGNYWVRMYGVQPRQPEELLREFGLRVN